MIKIILLGLVQGVTEFLPVSSSGHLAVLHHWLNYSPSLSFDVLAHLGTLLSIAVFFGADLAFLSRSLLGWGKKDAVSRGRRLLAKLFWASLPTAIVGFLLSSRIEAAFTNRFLLSGGFTLTALLLILGRFCRYPVGRGRAFLVGLFQSLAVMPGVSRSGATINGALILGEERRNAFKFSFFLGLVAISGAVIYQSPSIIRLEDWQLVDSLVALVSAFLSGLLAIKVLHRLFLTDKMWYLASYCLVLAGIVLFGW